MSDVEGGRRKPRDSLDERLPVAFACATDHRAHGHGAEWGVDSKREGERMRRLIVVAASVAMLAAARASGALAGEVKGPPYQQNNTNETGALDHANSACAASGLNDFDTSDPVGQLTSQVQTAADSWKY